MENMSISLQMRVVTEASFVLLSVITGRRKSWVCRIFERQVDLAGGILWHQTMIRSCCGMWAPKRSMRSNGRRHKSMNLSNAYPHWKAKAEYAKRVLSSALSRRVKVPLALKWGAPYPKAGVIPRWPKKAEGMQTSKRARRRKLDTAKAELEPLLAVLRRAGCPPWGESEGHEEKYRAVIDGETWDEPVSQRWGKVESELRRRRRSHSPTAPRWLRAARYGRMTRDLRRTGRVLGWHRGKRTYKQRRSGEWCSVSSRTAE